MDLPERIGQLSPGKRALLERYLSAARPQPGAAREPVAIVGVGCRFPGRADDAGAFWRLLCAGTDTVTEVPPERWDVERYHAPAPGTPGRTSSRWGAFLGDVDRFDAAFFGISPREAMSLDPQQRLLLEVAWEALEDAGLPAERVTGTRGGVFVGIGPSDYFLFHQRAADLEGIDVHSGTGGAASFAAGRLSYFLGLHGPSVALDTACSSSLVAVHLACQSLRSRESDLALAGGVSLVLSPAGSIYFSMMRALAADGRCKAFDAGADGFVRGEGCAVLVLKRLSDALAAGDPVHAVVLGSAVNHGGRGAGLTVPSASAQQALMRRALEDAGVDAAEVGYVEAHGTGTALGDPIEAHSLAAVYAASRPAERPLLVGSVKTNLGHLEAAAGVAGLLKAALVLRHGEVPPHLHLRALNPHIDWRGLPISIPTTRTPWPGGPGRRLAAVSAFGFSGTNCHLVLEAPPAPPRAPLAPSRAPPPLVLPLSAHSPEALREKARDTGRLLASGTSAADLCFTAATRRSHLRHRRAVVGRDAGELCAALQALAEERPGASGAPGLEPRRKLVFVFPGHGTAWLGLGPALLEAEPVVRETLAACEEALRPYLDGRPLAQRAVARAAAPMGDALEPLALFATQVALAALWRSWGVEPDAVVGHSVGEVAAAHVAGVLGLEDAARVVGERSRAARGTAGMGAMAVVELPHEQARALLRERGAGERLWVAAINSPVSTVLSGEPAALDDVLAVLSGRGVFCRRVEVDYPSHCPLMAPAAGPLRAALTGLSPGRARYRLVSTVRGGPVDGPELDAAYWARNLAEPVLFAPAVDWLADGGHSVFVEVGPQPSLGPALARCLRARGAEATVLASARREEAPEHTLRQTLAALYGLGWDVAWERLHAGGGARVSLPRYPWRRERFWAEPRAAPPPEAPSGPRLVREESLDAGERAWLEAWLATWGGDGVFAVNRRHLAPSIFFGAGRRAVAFVDVREATLFALLLVGPDAEHAPLARELAGYAASRGLQLSLVAHERQVPGLREWGFSTTPCGVWQALEDLRGFSLEGRAMGRLRYMVRRYERTGHCLTAEHVPGGDARVDREVCALIDAWVRHKRRPVPFVPVLKEQLLQGRLDARHRLFLTRRDGVLEAAVLLSPVPARRGYLMDLEFYAGGAPLGCLELTIVRLIERLREEGAEYLGLGGTFGTGLGPHPGEDPAAASLLAELHDSGVLDGDGNLQFKRKFRPAAAGLYLCRPPGSAPPRMRDVLALLGQAAPPGPGAHPLLGREVRLATGEAAFEAHLSSREPAFLSGHRLRGQVVLPATAYLELALAAAAAVLGEGRHALEELVFAQPLILTDGGARRVQVLLRPREGSGAAAFEVYSQEHEEGPWVRHATGWLREASGPLAGAGLEGARERCRRSLSPEVFYASLAQRGFEYGPGFRLLRELHLGEGEALGRARLPPGAWEEVGRERIHPALLDACTQLLLALWLDTAPGDGLLLLQGLASWRIDGPAGEEVRAHARVEPDGGGGFQASLTLAREDGQPFASLRGAFVRPLVGGALTGEDRSLRAAVVSSVEWRPATGGPGEAAGGEPLPPPPVVSGADAGDGWLVLPDAGGLGALLEERLRARGVRCQRVDTAEGVALRWEGAAPRGVVDLRALDGAVPADAAGEDVLRACAAAGTRATRVLQALMATGLPRPPRLWLVTRGAQPVRPPLPPPLAQAAVWGVGRVAAREHPELLHGLLDLDPDAGLAEQAACLASALEGPGAYREVAFRSGVPHVPRLLPLPPGEAAFAPGPEGAWLVTGGFGGLGLEVARWLVEAGARHLVLCGRGPAGPEARRHMESLRASGARVSAAVVDVCDSEALRRLLAGLEAPLRGVLHAAGVLDDGALFNLDEARFLRVLAPKVQGAWNLHQATRHLPLDAFVLFSSAAALYGPPGQANHAAASAALDALAHHRRALGLPASSLDWGPWGEVGQAAGRVRVAGGSLSTRGALDGLARALRHPSPQLAILPAPGPSLPTARAPGDRRPVEPALALLEQLAAVARLPVERLPLESTLQELGFNSLMVLELRERLERRLELRLPILELFRAPVARLLERVRREAAGPAAPAPVREEAEDLGALTGGKAYFNHGARGLLSHPARRAMERLHEELRRAGPFSLEAQARLAQELRATRAALAEALCAPPGTLALTDGVSSGCGLVLWGLDWSPGDHLLLSDAEFPAIRDSALELCRRFGLELTTFPAEAPDVAAEVERRLRPRTRLVVLSHVLWGTGHVLPVAAVAARCHAANALLLVDGAQSFGVLPLDVPGLGADFYAVTGAKWLGGPEGTGGLYIRQEARELLRPLPFGTRGVPPEAAARFDVGAWGAPALAGLREALAVHARTGPPEARYARVRERAAWLAEQLATIPGLLLRSPLPPEAGIVSFQVPGHDPEELARALEAEGVLVRAVTGPGCLRACVHPRSTRDEAARLVTWTRRLLVDSRRRHA